MKVKELINFFGLSTGRIYYTCSKTSLTEDAFSLTLTLKHNLTFSDWRYGVIFHESVQVTKKIKSIRYTLILFRMPRVIGVQLCSLRQCLHTKFTAVTSLWHWQNNVKDLIGSGFEPRPAPEADVLPHAIWSLIRITRKRPYKCFFFYKHNVYKHTEPDFWWKFKHTLSITPSLNLRHQQNFFFEFNQSNWIIRAR